MSDDLPILGQGWGLSMGWTPVTRFPWNGVGVHLFPILCIWAVDPCVALQRRLGIFSTQQRLDIILGNVLVIN